MGIDRLFIAVRDTAEYGRQYAFFTSLDEATDCYEDAAYVVRNAPGEGRSDDLTIISGAALYAAETSDRELARAMVDGGNALLLAVSVKVVAA
jgi:hypothetical protein